MKKYIISLSLALLISLAINAQSYYQSSFYNQNLYSLNPAYAGINKCLEVSVQHKQQWGSIKDAPVNYLINGHKSLSDRVGLGANLNVWNSNLLKHNNFGITYAYHLPINETFNLHFGLSAGMIQHIFMAENAVVFDKADILLLSGEQKNVGFVTDFGMMFSAKNFKFGLSAPRIIRSKFSYKDIDTESGFNLKNNIILHTSYHYELNEKMILEPSLLFRTMAGNGSYADIYTRGIWNNQIGLGVGYRTPSGVFTTVEVQVNNMLRVSYCYDIANSGISNLGGSSHEIMLGIKLCNDKKKALLKQDEDVKEPTPESRIVIGVPPAEKESKPVDPIVEESKIVEQTTEETKVVPDSTIVERVIGTVSETIVEPEVAVVPEVAVESETTEAEITESAVKFEPKTDTELTVEPKVETKTVDNKKVVADDNIREINISFNQLENILLFKRCTGEIVSDNETNVVADLIGLLKRNPSYKIRVIGHADDSGDEDYNYDVSIMRAVKLKNILIEGGIDVKRITVNGKGEKEPMFLNDCKAGRRKNRRTQIIISK